MKSQRSRFYLISLLLLALFLLTVFLCARHIGLFLPPAPADEEAGNQPVTEESLKQSDNIPENIIPLPESTPAVDSPYDITGL